MDHIADEQKELARTLYVKAYLPCDEIAKRIGFSRQSVHLILKKMGVDTRKQKVVCECSGCGATIEKLRSKFRVNENHFCNPACYAMWTHKPEVITAQMAMKVAREKCMAAFDYERCTFSGYFLTTKDTLLFQSREAMLEWKRTGLPARAFSMSKFTDVTVTNRGGRVSYAREA